MDIQRRYRKYNRLDEGGRYTNRVGILPKVGDKIPRV